MSETEQDPAKQDWTSPRLDCPRCGAHCLTDGKVEWCSLSGCGYGIGSPSVPLRSATTLDLLDRQHRYLVAEVASVARFLLDDGGFTRKHAAQSLANSVRDHNAGSWTDADLAVLLGVAGRLPRVRNVHPADLYPVAGDE